MDATTLDPWLSSPSAPVPGTTMYFTINAACSDPRRRRRGCRRPEVKPQFSSHENSPALPLRAVHLSDRAVLGRAFFRVPAFSVYVSSSATTPHAHHLDSGLPWRTYRRYVCCKEDSATERISLMGQVGSRMQFQTIEASPIQGARQALPAIGRLPNKFSSSWNCHVGTPH
jgi:hypothetical protein